MNKLYAMPCIALMVTLIGLTGCNQETVTSTVMTTVAGPTQTMTATSTVSAAAQTVTVTEIQSVTIIRTITSTATSQTMPKTTSTSKTTSFTTQIGTIDLSGIVIEIDNSADDSLTPSKCQITLSDDNTLIITGWLYAPKFTPVIAIIQCTFFDSDGIEIGTSEEVRINCAGVGSSDKFSIEYSSTNIAQIAKCLITIAV
jgi:hypothetical protein